MEIKIDDSRQKFNPIKIEFTIESLEELGTFCALFNSEDLKSKFKESLDHFNVVKSFSYAHFNELQSLYKSLNK